MKSGWSKVRLLGLTGLAIVAILSLQMLRLQQLASEDETSDRATQQALYSVNSANLAGMLSYSNLAADWLWLRFVQYFGDFFARQETGYGLSQDYLETAVKLDPSFLDAYLFSTFAFAWKQALPQKAIDLLMEGTKHIQPDEQVDAYRLWYRIALIEALWIGDAASAQYAFEQTAQSIESLSLEQIDRADIVLIPNNLRDLGEQFATNPRSAQVRFDIWMQVLAEAATQEARQLALSQLELVGGLERLPSGELRFVRPSS